ERPGKTQFAVEIGRAVIHQVAAVRIGAEVAFEGRVRRQVERALPTHSGQEGQASRQPLFEAEHERMVIGNAERASKRQLRAIWNGTPRVGVRRGGTRTIDGGVPL